MQTDNNTEEITLKDIILTIGEYFTEAIKMWWVIAACVMLSTTLMYYKHKKHTDKYISTMKFSVESKQGGGTGGIASILGNFGFRGGKVNPYKVIEVAKSSHILDSVFFKNGDMSKEGQNIVHEYDLIAKWSKSDTTFVNLDLNRFRSFDELTKSFIKKKLLKMMWNGSNPICQISLNTDSNLYNISITTTNENLSFSLVNLIYKELKQFFEYAIFKKQLKAAEILKSKVDSLKKTSIDKAYELARLREQNLGLVSKKVEAKISILMGEINANNLVYSEVLKNYELSDYSLKDNQPLFIKIDQSYIPLQKEKSSLLKNIIIGIIAGGMVGIFIIVLRKFFSDLLAN